MNIIPLGFQIRAGSNQDELRWKDYIEGMSYFDYAVAINLKGDPVVQGKSAALHTIENCHLSLPNRREESAEVGVNQEVCSTSASLKIGGPSVSSKWPKRPGVGAERGRFTDRDFIQQISHRYV
jgi:hypothetical protein